MSIYSGKVLGYHRARAELAIHDLKKELDKRATRLERLALIREWFATAITSRIAPNKRPGEGISVKESEAYLKAKDGIAAYFKDDFVFGERHLFWPRAGVFRRYLRRKMNGADEAWEKAYLDKAVEAYDETVPLLYGSGMPLSLSTSIKQTFAREEYLDAIQAEMKAVVREWRKTIPGEGVPTRSTTPGLSVLIHIREGVTGGVGYERMVDANQMGKAIFGKSWETEKERNAILQDISAAVRAEGWATVLLEEYEKRVIDAQISKVIDKAFAKAHNWGGQYLPDMNTFDFDEATEDVGRLVEDPNTVEFGKVVQKQVGRRATWVLRQGKKYLARIVIQMILRRERPQEEHYAYNKQMQWHTPAKG